MKSMTGMGRAQGKAKGIAFVVEVRSVNHRFCEVSTRLPPRYQALEMPIAEVVRKTLTRGKIDVSLYEEKGEADDIPVNEKALKNYHALLKKISKTLKLTEPVNLSHIQQGASLYLFRSEEAASYWPTVKKLLVSALDDLSLMRAREGENLKKYMRGHLSKLKELHAKIDLRKDEVVTVWQDKLNERIKKLARDVEVDPVRLATEVALFADRSDITEELNRLLSHFEQMEGLMVKKEPIGRAFDFLLQEINREWNTIGSKAQDVGITHDVVAAKGELEKMKEQIQNVE